MWIALRSGRTNFNPRQKRVQAVVRSLLLAALACALARPVISLGSSRLSVVYLVDVSHSVSGRALTDAAARIDALTNEHPAVAHAASSPSAPNVQVLDDTAKLRALAPGRSRPCVVPGGVERQASDLERALHQARAEIAPGHLPRIVLFSDGRETSGDVARGRHAARRGGRPRLRRSRWRRASWAMRGSNAVHLPDASVGRRS